MKQDIDFLSVDDVLVLHERQLARYGGAAGVRDARAIDAAVAMPRTTFDGDLLHADLNEMAAAYAFHLCQDHPFLDGNKRTALLAALVFLDLNRVAVADPDGRLYEAMMGVAEGQVDKKGLTALLRELTLPPRSPVQPRLPPPPRSSCITDTGTTGMAAMGGDGGIEPLRGGTY